MVWETHMVDEGAGHGIGVDKGAGAHETWARVLRFCGHDVSQNQSLDHFIHFTYFIFYQLYIYPWLR